MFISKLLNSISRIQAFNNNNNNNKNAAISCLLQPIKSNGTHLVFCGAYLTL